MLMMKEFSITGSAGHTILLKMLLGSWSKDGEFSKGGYACKPQMWIKLLKHV